MTKKFENIKVVTLDFDGTLVDSMGWLTSIATTLIEKYYHLDKKTARKKYIETTGLPFVQQIKMIFPGSPLNEKVVAEFERIKEENFNQQSLFPDSKEVLEYLKEKNYIIAVSSGTFTKLIISYCKAKNLDQYIDEMLGWKPGFEKGKDHFNYLIKKYNVTSKEIVFIGDSLNDARRALTSNVEFIGKIGLFSENDFKKIFKNGNIPLIKKLKEVKLLL